MCMIRHTRWWDRSNKYADAKADEAADVTKSTYNKIKDSIGGFFGSAKESAEECAPCPLPPHLVSSYRSSHCLCT